MTKRMPWLVLAGALSGCSIDRTTRETTFEGAWSPTDVELFPGSSLSIEDATTHERVAVTVDADGHVHAERSHGDEVEIIDTDSFEALKRDHPELVAALRAFRIEWSFHSEITTEIRSD